MIIKEYGKYIVYCDGCDEKIKELKGEKND